MQKQVIIHLVKRHPLLRLGDAKQLHILGPL